jgi:hypothetical protein
LEKARLLLPTEITTNFCDECSCFHPQILHVLWALTRRRCSIREYVSLESRYRSRYHQKSVIRAYDSLITGGGNGRGYIHSNGHGQSKDSKMEWLYQKPNNSQIIKVKVLPLILSGIRNQLLLDSFLSFLLCSTEIPETNQRCRHAE